MLKQLGKYEVIEELGKGAMGIVYKAYDPLMARYVALKTMSYTNASDPEFKKRFYKEAQAPGRLHHDNIVIIYELNEDQGIPFIAMEYLEGSDLQRLIHSDHIFTLRKIIDIMVQVCEGLQFAHLNGIIHRDVKPANIFLIKNTKVKIVDFGIAHISQSSLMTRTGVMLGTPSYMSPEQVRCEPLSGASDQFSVGVILYELFTGHRPFEGETYTNILYKILHEEPAAVRDFYPTCPPELEALVIKTLAKTPADRFLDLASVARRLRKIEAELDQDMTMEPTLQLTRSPQVTAGKSIKLEMIQRYVREGKYDQALRILEKLRSSGESPEILEALQQDIQSKQQLGRLEELVNEGSEFYQDDHYELALECFNEALAIDPGNERVLEWVRKTHQKEAEQRVRHSIQQYLEKGNRLIEEGNHPEALRVLGEALKLNPAAAEVAEKIKQVQRLQEQHQKETQCHTLCQMASQILEEGKEDEALQGCQQAREILPSYPQAMHLRQHIEQQRREETIRLALQELEALFLKKKFDQALTLAGDTIQKVGLDDRLQGLITRIESTRRRRVIVPLALSALVLLVVIAIFVLRPGGEVKPPPPPPGFLVLDIRPQATLVGVVDAATGKAVTLADQELPLRLALPPGRYTVSYRNDALLKEPAAIEVRIASGKTELVSRKLPGFNTPDAVQSILGKEPQP